MRTNTTSTLITIVSSESGIGARKSLLKKWVNKCAHISHEGRRESILSRVLGCREGERSGIGGWGVIVHL